MTDAMIIAEAINRACLKFLDQNANLTTPEAAWAVVKVTEFGKLVGDEIVSALLERLNK